MSNINNSIINNKVRKLAAHFSDDDLGSTNSNDQLKKRWLIASSDCDFPKMLSLLKEQPELCKYRDSIMGYNALHWAAKFNKPEIIKSIAGDFKVDPNLKTFSGHTPLHIAAQFKNKEIMKILIYHYGANKDIRDNYGKKPYQYLEKNQKIEKQNQKFIYQ